jgi:hypothetical protein
MPAEPEIVMRLSVIRIDRQRLVKLLDALVEMFLPDPCLPQIAASSFRASCSLGLLMQKQPNPSTRKLGSLASSLLSLHCSPRFSPDDRDHPIFFVEVALSYARLRFNGTTRIDLLSSYVHSTICTTTTAGLTPRPSKVLNTISDLYQVADATASCCRPRQSDRRGDELGRSERLMPNKKRIF